MSKAVVVLVSSVLITYVVADDCSVTSDGVNGDCTGIVNALVIGDADLCDEGDVSEIDSSTLGALSGITHADSIVICGVQLNGYNSTNALLPELIAVSGAMTFGNIANLDTIEFEHLELVANIIVKSSPLVVEISLPRTSYLGTFVAINNAKLKTIDLHIVTAVGGLGTPYQNDGINYCFFIRNNPLISDVCDFSPATISNGVFICHNGNNVQIRDVLENGAGARTLCNTTHLPTDAKCPCAYAYEPKLCKGSPKGKKFGIDRLGVRAIGGVGAALCAGVFAGYYFMHYRNRRLNRRNLELDDQEMASHSERTPLFASSASASGGVAPPSYDTDFSKEKPPSYTVAETSDLSGAGPSTA